jgi:putative DNA primase/helicase
MHMYEQRTNGLYISNKNAEFEFLCGPIKVLAITRDSENRHSYGRLIEWTNIDNKVIRHVFQGKQLLNDNGRQLKEVLVDSGLHTSSRRYTWDLIFTYINQTIPNERLICSVQTGWLNNSFITPDWCIGNENEPVIYAGDKQNLLMSKGTLTDWQQHVAPLCQQNPMLIFAICTGLAAPLLQKLNWQSCGFHLYGKSKIAKTTVLNLAASLYSDSDFSYSWRSTANGLEVIAATHNDLLLCLDELHQAQAEDVDQAVYMLANGISKIRSNKESTFATKSKWRLLYLSTGEIGLEEKLSSIQKNIKAGQEIRFIEVPATREHGIYDQLHQYASIQQFSKAIWDATKQCHGTFIPEWIKKLTELDNLDRRLGDEVDAYQNSWIAKNAGNQVKEVTKRFALLAAAGELAITLGLLPWPKGEVERSIRLTYNTWVDNRSSEADSEDEKIVVKLPIAMKRWRSQLIQPGKKLEKKHSGYSLVSETGTTWLLTREAFIQGLDIRYSNQVVQIARALKEKGWLVNNENRLTFKKYIEGGLAGGRYYKLLVDEIVNDLELDRDLCQT